MYYNPIPCQQTWFQTNISRSHLHVSKCFSVENQPYKRIQVSDFLQNADLIYFMQNAPWGDFLALVGWHHHFEQSCNATNYQRIIICCSDAEGRNVQTWMDWWKMWSRKCCQKETKEAFSQGLQRNNKQGQGYTTRKAIDKRVKTT